MNFKKPASTSHPDEPVRLSKLMSERGLCSRREADVFIEKGWVRVNGEVVRTLGVKFLPDVKIELSSEAMRDQKSLVTIVLNKPIGYVSAQPEPGYTPAIRLITRHSQFTGGRSNTSSDLILKDEHFDGLAVTGRLDIDSQGLLLFTQDGRLAKKLIGEDTEIEKEYLVRVEGRLSDQDLKLLNYGLELDGDKLKPAKVEWVNEDQLRFVLKEGKKRQIRRMCELVGLRVTGLKRVRIGRLKLSDLPEGQWRFVRPDEIV